VIPPARAAASGGAAGAPPGGDGGSAVGGAATGHGTTGSGGARSGGTGTGAVWLREVEIRGDEFPRRDVYPFDLPLFQGRQVLRFAGNATFFVGENGSGKSTLIEAMARRCGLYLWAETGRRGAMPVSWRSGARSGARSGGRSGGHEDRREAGRAGADLSDYLQVTVARGPVRGGVFSADSFRQWAEFLDDLSQVDPGHAKYHGGADLTLRSRGEGLLAYFRGRYQVPGLYFLDEPEAALSPVSQLALLRLLAEYRERGHAQFILATHSPILMALPGAQVFSFGERVVQETHFEDTAHFRLYRDFMADPASFSAAPPSSSVDPPLQSAGPASRLVGPAAFPSDRGTPGNGAAG
jgi:predicted ATPase